LCGMKPNGLGMVLWFGAGLTGAALGGCALKRQPPETVLATRDFVADPGTMPTEGNPPGEGASTRSAGSDVKTVSGAEASEGIVDVIAKAEAPSTSPAAAPTGGSVLIDQKVGEINGRPIRVRDVLDDVTAGKRLETAARTRRLSANDWFKLTGRFDPRSESQPLPRDGWMQFARMVCGDRVKDMLRSELLEAEARASLRPEQKQGLAYLVNEAWENQRRESGGSRAAAERRLGEKGQTERQFQREHESKLLIEFELMERIYKKIRVSWKDVRLYYERHQERFNPPPVARFRLIRVAGTDADGIGKVQAALDGGEPFDAVASRPPNFFHVEEGGLGEPLGDKPLSGEFAATNFGFAPALERAAHELTPGRFVRVDVGRDAAWLYLESISTKSRALSDRDVQLEILRTMTNELVDAELGNYLQRLKDRASFSDLDMMVEMLVEAAAERYWPAR
jgi:hypothetical protein